MPKASSKRTKVLACGSNLFGQIHAESKNRSATPLSTVQDAASVVAACTYQTITRDHFGSIKALGEGANVVEQVCRTIRNDGPPRLDQLVFVGQDMFEAIVDVETCRCYFLQYDEEEDGGGGSSVVENSTWKTAAADGRGRCMAIDQEGLAYFFETVGMFRAATGENKPAAQIRGKKRFRAQRHTSDGSRGSAIPTLPKFQKVSAGNAHFVLLAQTSEEESPVWIFGDARFGAVPMLPFEHTTMVGVLASTDASSFASKVPTDIELLMPVPHFSTDQGFPSHIADVVAGARHTLVLTTDGDLYGWGWNEDACLLSFADSETPEWEENVVYGPTLISLPSSPEEEDDTVALSKVACSNGRSFGITTDGQLVVAGSNELGCLGLDSQLERLPKKPRFERDFSQIKKPYDCVNGFQLHPTLHSGSDVHATSLATFITVDLEKASD